MEIIDETTNNTRSDATNQELWSNFLSTYDCYVNPNYNKEILVKGFSRWWTGYNCYIRIETNFLGNNQIEFHVYGPEKQTASQIAFGYEKIFNKSVSKLVHKFLNYYSSTSSSCGDW